MNVISVKNLCFSYPLSDKKAVDNVSFQIEEGSYNAIVGTNGSGKSTIARLIAGLEIPDSGSIEIPDGVSIGLVFQSPKDQIVSSIVNRDTAFGPQNLHLAKSEIELRTIECLSVVDILDKSLTSTSALSLGQTQKVALAGMLATWPKVLILDESVAMLDPDSRKSVFEFLSQWHKHGKTIIHITHDLDAVKQTNRTIAIESGKLFFDGTTKDFLSVQKNALRIEGKKLPECNRQKTNEKFKSKPDVFEFSKVNFSYKGDESSFVKDISFSLKKGSLTALTGPSGAGKSTIMEIGSGLLKCDSGDIYSKIRPVIVQQNSSDSLFERFAADDVAFGPKKMGIKGKELQDLVISCMEKVGLDFDTFASKNPSKMSGGEQKRLSIAGMLALNSDIIFFDEPTAGVDGISRNKIMQLLKSLCSEGKTVLFSTHRRDEADFADREISINKGQIVKDTFEKYKSSSLDMNFKKESKNPLKEIPASSMLTSLRQASYSLSGASKRKASLLEKLTPSLRIVFFLAMFVCSLCFNSIIPCSIMLALSLLYCKLAGFSFKKLIKNSLKIFPFLLFFAVFQMIFHPALENEIHFTEFKCFLITPSKLLLCLVTFIKTYSALACICACFVSIPEYELIDGLKVLLKPLELIKIPVRYFILIMEIIFSYIPLLIDEAESIIKTQIVRGAMNNVKGPVSKIKSVIPLIVPLIIQTIKKSEALADAITMRCFK